MIIHQIEQTHFSDSEALIIQFILNKGMDIKHMTTKEIAEATYTSPSSTSIASRASCRYGISWAMKPTAWWATQASLCLPTWY